MENSSGLSGQITEMDALCETITRVKAEIAELEDQIELKKTSIKEIQNRVEQYFIETNREDPYRSPFGTLYLNEDISVIQPVGPEVKEIFEHFKQLFGEEVAWTKMTINNASLKSEIKKHTAAVEERGDDPILQPFPGVEPPKVLKQLRFRKAKG